MRMRFASLCTAILTLVVTAAAAPVAATDGGKITTVIELFTSQGCSSCPPADKLRASNGAYVVYVDGVPEANGNRGGNFGNWDANYQLALANELTNDRGWVGDMHLVAIYDRALSATEISQNFNAGPDCDPQTPNSKTVAGAEPEVPGLDMGPITEVFPNPFNGSFQFSFEALEDFQSVEVEIFDALGQKVFTQRYASDGSLVVKDLISLDRFSNGTYQMVVTSGDYRKRISLVKQ